MNNYNIFVDRKKKPKERELWLSKFHGIWFFKIKLAEKYWLMSMFPWCILFAFLLIVWSLIQMCCKAQCWAEFGRLAHLHAPHSRFFFFANCSLRRQLDWNVIFIFFLKIVKVKTDAHIWMQETFKAFSPLSPCPPSFFLWSIKINVPASLN